MKKTLFLDFDGVLFDTLIEVYLINRFEYLNKSFLDSVDEEFYSTFSKFKYLVYNIWMFYYYNPLIFNKEENIELKFSNALLNRDFEKEKEFVEKFINDRKKLILNHYDYWKNLERPYEFFFEIKKLYEKKNIDVVIISKKNKSSIIERFLSYDFKLDENKIFGFVELNNYYSKGDFMNEYIKLNNIDKAIFVDDNLNNILTSNNSKVENILALWGNSQPNAEGLNQNSAIEKIKKFFE